MNVLAAINLIVAGVLTAQLFTYTYADPVFISLIAVNVLAGLNGLTAKR